MVMLTCNTYPHIAQYGNGIVLTNDIFLPTAYGKTFKNLLTLLKHG